MDRAVAAIIVLGVFLGSVNSLVLVARQDELPSLVGIRGLSAEKTSLLADEGYQTLEAAPEAGTVLDVLGSVSDDASERQAVVPSEKGGAIPPPDAACSLSVGEEGVEANYHETKTRYVYTGYTMALARLGPGGISAVEKDLAEAGATVIDEAGATILILVPKNLVQNLDSLAQRGLIHSVEVGGWGSGLGKA